MCNANIYYVSCWMNLRMVVKSLVCPVDRIKPISAPAKTFRVVDVITRQVFVCPSHANCFRPNAMWIAFEADQSGACSATRVGIGVDLPNGSTDLS
uniref:Uncharacterized protein n=1 Tax=Anopheles atroparvus TaxID=41427 RepID=A0AAG5DW90_ANOAO